tara:strand:- start:1192 stop:2127 length:936 start_codon:yes stop_codon:yes gene_type:complete
MYKSLLSSVDLSVIEIQELFDIANNIKNQSFEKINNKILVNVFFEPSTRTSLSFECAMKRMGGNVINFQKDTSSLKKGESFEDTIKTLSQYGDIMVLRHPQVGKVSSAKCLIDIPLINGGDGSGEHPSQALLDLYTMYKHFGSEFEKKTILFIGDIKNSRTIHSLLMLIHKYPNMKIHFLSYSGLEASPELIERISIIHNQDKSSIVINKMTLEYDTFVHNLFDIVYVTRLQKERLEDIECVNTDFVISNEFANKLKDDAIIMHPLPRNNEILREVDNNSRCYYFKQMKYGIDIRMALILKLFNNETKNPL